MLSLKLTSDFGQAALLATGTFKICPTKPPTCMEAQNFYFGTANSVTATKPYCNKSILRLHFTTGIGRRTLGRHQMVPAARVI